MIGQTISHYRIIEKLGEGGMGVVYKAQDTKLNRIVALKFLPHHLEKGTVEQSRFLQEAQAAAVLNHPHICVIHDVREEEGKQFIVMEFVEGKTIRETIQQGPMKIDTAVGYAIQIAEALEEAHGKGIVHRDIKADNIMINSGNQIKVMDFGLAKLKGSLKLTRTSSTVGTLAYMAPEQIQGGGVDPRSDIFALGVLFYEMLSGHLPFRGEHEAAMMYSIINEDPQPIQKYRDDISSELDHILNRALEKNPEERYQTVKEMAIDLRRAKKDSTRVVRTSAMHQMASRREVVAGQIKAQSSKKKLWLGLGAVAALVVLAALTYFIVGKNSASSLPPMKTIAFTSYRGYAVAPAFSPEGNSIAFAWNGDQGNNFDIYIKLIDAGSPLRLTNDPAYEADPAWSPDGRYIAFDRSVGEGASYFIIPSLGGNERKITDVKSSGYGIDWSPDGKSLVVAASDDPGEPNHLVLVSIESGQKKKLTSPNKNGFYGDTRPKFSPDGSLVAYTKSFSIGRSELYTVPSGGGEEKRLTFDNLAVENEAWTADGREIVFSSNRGGNLTLWRISSDGGSPTPIPNSGENVTSLAIGKKGNNLAYSREAVNMDIWRMDLGVSASARKPPTELVSSTQSQVEPQYSPDGKYIAFTSNRSGSVEIWACHNDGSNPVQLTFFGGPPSGTPRWSPDSRFIAFDSREKGNGNIYVISVNGGTPRQLTSGNFENNIPSWSRDGRWIYFSSNRSGVFQVWKIPVDGGEAIQLTKNGGFDAFESYDGKDLYFVQKPNNTEIFKLSFAGGEEQSVDKRLSGLSWGDWELTDKGIYFAKPDTGQKGHIYFYSFSSRQINQIAATEKTIYPYSGAFAASPDGHSLLFTQVDRTESDIMLIQNFH